MTREFEFEDLKQCTNINYNSLINIVYITVRNKGVYWFVPSQEQKIKKTNSFPSGLSYFMKMGMVFNGVQGILKDEYKIYYCSNLLEDQVAVEFEYRSSRVSEVVFLNERYVAVLYLKKRVIVVFDLEEYFVVSEIEVCDGNGNDEGSATSMSINEDKNRLIVGVKSGELWDKHSLWGYIYQFSVDHQVGEAPIIEKMVQSFSLGSSNSGVYDLKITRMPKFNNELMILASIIDFSYGKK